MRVSENVSVRFVKEGEQQVGPNQGEKGVDWCVKNLGLQTTDWIGPDQLNLTIGQKTPLGAYAAYRFVVVKIDADDVSAKGWKPDFYLLQMRPTDARKVLETVG